MKQKTPLIRKLIFYIFFAFLLGSALPTPCQAEPVTISEARIAATNWINLIIHKRGDWGGSASATVKEVKPLKRGDRNLGYFCQVSPQGYIVLSLLKELSPVTDFSYESNLDPYTNEGMADLIKGCIERTLDAIEKQAGPVEKATTEQLQRILPGSRKDSWEQLLTGPPIFEESLGSIEPLANYQEGQELLTSRWHQLYPYNMWCPAPPGGSGCTENNCTVGCVGLSACEIMRYWNWPPYGTVAPYSNQYAWWFMPDKAYSNSSVSVKIAVAELCSEVADAILSDYCVAGGCETSSNFTRVKNAIETYFRYATASPELFRTNYTNEVWFNIIKWQLDMNRPVQYSYPGHAIVADGWMEVDPGPDRFLHLCYGFVNEGNTDWHRLEAIPGGGETTDVIMINIYPAPSLGPSPSGVYAAVPSFPYRYFDRDCTSSSAVFQAGHKLQFLPNIAVRSIGTIKFEGSSTSESRLFTRGDTSNGIRLNNGGISLYTNGNLKLY